MLPSMVHTFRDVIDAFGGPAAFAEAVGAPMKVNTAKVARYRDSISVRWFPAVAEAARRLGKPEIDEKTLSRLAAERKALAGAA